MTKAAAIRQSDLQRIFRAAKAEGVDVASVEVNGIKVQFGAVDASAEKEPDSVEQWRRKRDAQKLGGRRA